MNVVNEMEAYFDRLWPICRSITGEGLRTSFKILQEIIPLKLTEVPTGTKVFDWEIPNEWNIRDAWIKCQDGKKYCDFKKNNLHIVNYSKGIHASMDFDELNKHLFFHTEFTNAIPYLTSYYKENWGFCLTKEEYDQMPKTGNYEVFIDAEHKSGSLTYGELLVPGRSEEEILISTYLCHPSLANNELSGPLLTAFLYKSLIEKIRDRYYSYRFLVAPETIGVIAFLAEKGAHLRKLLKAGLVVTCVGDSGSINYKKSKEENTLINNVVEHILKYSDYDYSIRDFSVMGSDERQYCSPGFNFPVGSLMRTPYKEYKEYHTSLDNKNIISFPAMEEMVNLYIDVFKAIELNRKYRVNQLFCELHLSKYDLYMDLGKQTMRGFEIDDLLHFLSYADGSMELLEIAEKKKKSIFNFETIVKICLEKNLIHFVY